MSTRRIFAIFCIMFAGTAKKVSWQQFESHSENFEEAELTRVSRVSPTSLSVVVLGRKGSAKKRASIRMGAKSRFYIYRSTAPAAPRESFHIDPASNAT